MPFFPKYKRKLGLTHLTSVAWRMRRDRVWAYKRPSNTIWSSLTKLCQSTSLLAISPLTPLLSYTPPNTFVAAYHFTIALLPGGPSLITHPPVWYKPELVKTEKELEDEELKALLARNLRENKKSKKKRAKAEDEADDATQAK